MKITICGSMAFAEMMTKIADQLHAAGHETEVPNIAEGVAYDVQQKKEFIDEHFGKIDGSDAVLIVNETKGGVEHYIGGNTLMEITYAYAQGSDVFLLNPIPEVSYADEIRAMQPVVLDGDVTRIDEYCASLPLAYMSSESPVKHLAVSRGLRRAGIRVRLDGKKVDSGVSEQPMTIDETYEGAMIRHDNLKALGVAADYLVTIESGMHPAHQNHCAFGCAVIIVEPVGGDRKIGIDLDLEFPSAMLDKVPSQYADLGTLIQQEYGSVLKDPYPFFTNNKLTRARLLENAVYNIAAQLGEDSHEE